MKSWSLNIRLLLAFGIFLAGFLLSHYKFIRNDSFKFNRAMNQAVELSQDWFNVIRKEKMERGIISDVNSNVLNHYLIGDDFTPITTTLGSLSAKEVSTNPDFAALMVRLIKEAGLKPGDKVGLVLSGSFPALAISTLAAIQTLELEAIVMSSLGASTYGANQEEATWIDMEGWLAGNEGMEYRSIVITRGAENDIGEGLIDEGIDILEKAASRNNCQFYLPENLIESIHYKLEIFSSEDIAVLINIGGNQSALGGCSHAASLPNGLHRELKLCNDPDRGLVQEMSTKGIPVINLLNIKDLAYRYGIDLLPGLNYAKSTNLFIDQNPNKKALLITLLIGFLGLGILFWSFEKTHRL
ncbi:MAG: poly-gamma-glutamate system protein [Bacteroidota bacterium]|nr:poly-gamma-glutamate system protein [Bacteroidota bacterium]